MAAPIKIFIILHLIWVWCGGAARFSAPFSAVRARCDEIREHIPGARVRCCAYRWVFYILFKIYGHIYSW